MGCVGCVLKDVGGRPPGPPGPFPLDDGVLEKLGCIWRLY
jgi:hypothetical protein